MQEQKKKRNGFLRHIIIFFAVLGPGIITANVDNDAGGIATYSVAGAYFGYDFLWTVIPVVFMLMVVQEMSARMGAVTGKGLADLIRENFGAKVAFYAMCALLFSNIGNTVSEFSGVAASLEIFGISKYISVPAAALVVWLLVVKGNFKMVEKVFLVACLFYLSYVISGFFAKPDWGGVIKSMIQPHIQLNANYLYMLIGVIGTTIAPWQLFFMQASVVEKRIGIINLKHSRLESIIGCLMAGVVIFFILLTCASSIYPAGIKIKSAADAALALEPLAGKYCSILFSFGLLNASLFAAVVLPLSIAYYVCEGLGFEAGVNKRFSEAPQFYSIFTATIITGMGLVLIPGFPLFRMMVLAQVVNGIVLPFMLIFMIILVNREDVMSKYTNSSLWNSVSWFTIISVIVLTVLMFGEYFR
jgi:Mn2+/Fe2+ NRAMP family transporter